MSGLKKIIFTIAMVLISITLVFALSAALTYKVNSMIRLKENGRIVVFKSTAVFHMSILIKEDKKAVLGFKIMSMNHSRLHELRVIKNAGHEYILYVTDNGLKLFNAAGELIGKKKTEPSQRIVSSYTGELTQDQNEEILYLTGANTSEYGDTLTILKTKIVNSRAGFSQIYRHTFKGLNPWKVQTSDVDNDGTKEISLGVYKKSKFHPVMAKRPFFYNWTGRGVTPKWLGSRLSKPFDNYILADINNDRADELVSIENTKDGMKVINSYTWKGFGFEGIGQSRKFSSISDIHFGPVNSTGFRFIIAKVKEHKKWAWNKFLFDSKKGIIFVEKITEGQAKEIF